MQTQDPMAGAVRWFIDLVTAEDVNELWPQFEQWLQQDTRNRRAYEEIEQSWSALYPVRATQSRPRQLSETRALFH